MRRNIECEPEYLRDRIEETNNLGRRYLVSIALLAVLIATIEGGFRVSDLSAEPQSVLPLAVRRASLEQPAHALCAILYPAMHESERRPQI